jgi:hypothetical protein
MARKYDPVNSRSIPVVIRCLAASKLRVHLRKWNFPIAVHTKLNRRASLRKSERRIPATKLIRVKGTAQYFSTKHQDGKQLKMSLPFRPIPTLLLTPVCHQCGQEVRLARIEPAAAGRELRTFECSACGYSKDVEFILKRA